MRKRQSTKDKNMRYFLKILGIIILIPLTGFSQAIEENPQDLQGIGIEEHLGDTIQLDYQFLNSRGDTVLLADYFNQGIPVILVLHYTSCPMLCSLVMDGLADGIEQLELTPGKDFQILSLSIDPREKVENAEAMKERYLGGLKNKSSNDAWEFLISPDDNSRIIADALGFNYFYVEETGEYAHPAAAFILTEKGLISRYLYGIEFKEFDLRMALLEASKGKIGNTVDKIVLYCYHYDPDAEGYVIFAGNIMRIGGVFTMLLLMGFLFHLWRKDRKRKAVKS